MILKSVYLIHDRVLATASDGSPLMYGDRTEVALAITAMVRRDRELNRLESSHFALGFVVGVHITLIAQLIDMVDLLCSHAWLWRVLDEIAVGMLLDESSRSWFIVGIEVVKHRDKGVFVRGTLLITGEFKVSLLQCSFCCFGDIADTLDTLYGVLISVGIGQLYDCLFCHAIDQYICLGIKEEASAYLVGPEVIVCDTTQACLHTTQYQWYGTLEMLTDEIGVLDDGTVWTTVVDSSGGKVITLAELFGSSVVGNHTIDQSTTDPPVESRLPQMGDVCPAVDIRLCDNTYTVSGIDQYLSHDRDTIVGGIDIGITGDEDDIELLPTKLLQLFGCSG
jgi:hypothetical protein